MRRAAVLVSVLTVASLGAQRPMIQNGNVETQTATTISRAVGALATRAAPVWIAWSVPMVPGDRNLCSTWSDGSTSVRGETLESAAGSRPTAPAPAGPVRLDSGTSLVVFMRVVEGEPERIRAIGDDCPVDATGTTVHWLTGITAADSVQYLDGLTRGTAPAIGPRRRVAESAVSAIALHQDASVLPLLDRLASAATIDGGLRRQAASGLAAHHGRAGFDRVAALIRAERARDLRRSFVGALAQSPREEASPLLLELARTDVDPGIRGDAAARYLRRVGEAALPAALALIDADAHDDVKRRVVAGIGALPEPVAAPALIRLARTHASLVVKKAALSSLGRFSDPQARALLEELLR